MPILHLANTYFEEEIATGRLLSPHIAIQQHPIFRKLEWIPFLYADPEDGVLVTTEPPESLFTHLPLYKRPHIELFSEKKPLAYERLVSWGASPSIATWAKKHHLAYSIPPWEVVCAVNSKEFSFKRAPKLKNSTLLYSLEEVLKWHALQKGPSVLKTCFGLSGRGHLLLPEHTGRIEAFTAPEFAKNRPVIAEPWVKRTLDFSTQWEILQSGEIDYIGMTLCINDSRGKYKETRVGDIPLPLHFEQHKETALIILKEMSALKFFGNVGIDAMIYENEEGKETLHPIVEINARKTMGWVALKIQERYFKKSTLSVAFSLTKKDLAVILTPWSY